MGSPRRPRRPFHQLMKPRPVMVPQKSSKISTDGILKSSRPVVLDNDDYDRDYELVEEYAYSAGGGTAFMCSYDASYFVVAPWHTIGAAGIERVCVFPTDLTRNALSFDYRTQGGSDSLELRDHQDEHDIVVLRVAHRSKQQIENKPYVIPLDAALHPPDRLTSDTQLVVSGYPGERRAAAAFKLRHQRYLLPARYDGVAPHGRFLHAIKFDRVAGLSSLGGMSGSPVFTREPGGKFGFAGMLIQEGYFMDVLPIMTALRRASGGTDAK